MNLLLDTHVTLWWFGGGRQLSEEATDAIRRAQVVYVSAVSAWEVAIKSSLGKLTLPGPLTDGVERSRFTKLPISFGHTAAVVSLPHHHTDPFDRLLIAQAIVENLTIVTHDEQFRMYERPVIWT